MCGIFFSARFAPDETESDIFRDLSGKLQAANAARGPDAQGAQRKLLHRPSEYEATLSAKSNLELEFFASELRLRGILPVVQPHEQDGDVFCWNGEIFEGMDILPEENDGIKLFNAIRETQRHDDLVHLFNNIEGPYAFVFYRAISQLLFFAVDPLGRRSLLVHRPTPANPYFVLSSVSVGSSMQYEFEELSTEAIYCFDLQRFSRGNDIVADFNLCLTLLPRSQDGSITSSQAPFSGHNRINPSLPPENLPCASNLNEILEINSLPIDDLLFHLNRSVMLQVLDIPHVSVSKSQARVAILFSGGIDCTVLTLLVHRNIPLDEPIDLLNVAFENPRKIQSQESSQGPQKIKSRKGGKERLDRHERVTYLVPDRITGLQELEELKRLCPGRVWNFVEVNVPYEESQMARPIVEALMWPRRTVMDMSLAMALYFVSRGVGRLKLGSDGSEDKEYTSQVRVLVSGLGSDELLGGYSRHRTAYLAGGWPAIVNELQLELDRIPTRNLGRDDRVISSHGKETRHPFLSLTVVAFLAQLPVHLKTDPRLSIGVGDKMLLRVLARKLGLFEASERKKRAMQFGCHSARMEGGEGDKKGDLLLS